MPHAHSRLKSSWPIPDGKILDGLTAEALVSPGNHAGTSHSAVGTDARRQRHAWRSCCRQGRGRLLPGHYHFRHHRRRLGHGASAPGRHSSPLDRNSFRLGRRSTPARAQRAKLCSNFVERILRMPRVVLTIMVLLILGGTYSYSVLPKEGFSGNRYSVFLYFGFAIGCVSA